MNDSPLVIWNYVCVILCDTSSMHFLSFFLKLMVWYCYNARALDGWFQFYKYQNQLTEFAISQLIYYAHYLITHHKYNKSLRGAVYFTRHPALWYNDYMKLLMIFKERSCIILVEVFVTNSQNKISLHRSQCVSLPLINHWIVISYNKRRSFQISFLILS